MNKKWGYWTLDTCLEDALKYTSKTAWGQNSPGAYDKAHANKWLEVCCKHMKPLKKRWTLEEAKEDALKYNSRQEWKRGKDSAYVSATNNKWLDICCKHMKASTTGFKWSEEALLNTSKKFNSKSTWNKAEPGAYGAAYSSGLLDKCCEHMCDRIKPRRYWTLERCKEEALKFKTRSQWFEESGSSYEIAKRRGWLNLCNTHMPEHSNKSRPEIEILEYVQSIYKNASSRFFKVENTKIPTKRFQLDIFIPELNKGIEFNGDYWHGIGFNRKQWNSPKHYHRTKQRYFKKIGILYINIWEKDWKVDKRKCLNRVLNFILGS